MLRGWKRWAVRQKSEDGRERVENAKGWPLLGRQLDDSAVLFTKMPNMLTRLADVDKLDGMPRAFIPSHAEAVPTHRRRIVHYEAILIIKPMIERVNGSKS